MTKQPKGLVVKDRQCPYCSKTFNINARVFANHVRWCTENPNYQALKESTSNKCKSSTLKRLAKKYGDVISFKVKCATCGKEFFIQEREKTFPNKEKYFCSKFCAHSHVWTKESRLKNSIKRQEYLKAHGYHFNGTVFTKSKENKGEKKVCPICKETFITTGNNQKYCSVKCNAKASKIKRFIRCGEKALYDEYKRQCAFTFGVKNYDQEFNYQLINENGWYKAKNHGDNLNGVSRDHMFSISEGFKQHIDPYLISHPANCQLLVHSQNSSKGASCSITIDELKERIVDWEKKYGVYQNKIDYTFIKDYIT